MKKIFYFDVETTGLNSSTHDIIQLAYIIEIDNEVKEEGNLFVQPFNYETINAEALKINSLTIAQLKTFQSPKEAYKKIYTILTKYVDKYDKKDKFSPAGYNVNFDIRFLKEFFIKNNDKYYGSLFDYHILDPITVLYFLEYKNLINLENYKLETVCKYFNIPLNAHDALSDIKAIKEVIKKLLTYLK